MSKSVKIIIVLCWIACGLFIYSAVNGLFTLSAEAYVRQAQQLAEQDREDEALEKLAKAAELYPDNAAIRLQAARIHLARGQFSAVIEHYYAALDKDPLLFLSSNFRSFVADAAKRDETREFLSALLRLSAARGEQTPEHAAALDINARVAHYRFKQAAQKAAYNATILDSKLSDMVLQDMLGGSFERARGILQNTDAQEEVRAAFEAAIGVAEINRKDAVEYFAASARLDESFAAPRISLAMLERRTQDLFDILNELDGRAVNVELLKARIMAELDRPDDAEDLVRQVLQREPNVEAKQLLSVLYFNRRDLDALQPLLDEFLEANSRDTLALFLQGSIEFADGDYSAALSHITAGSSGAQKELSRYYSALADVRLGKHNRAEATLRVLSGRRPQELQFHLARAVNALQAGNTTIAEQSCRAVLEQHPDDPDALRLLAAAQLSEGRVEDVIDTLQHYLRVCPESSAGVQALAAALISWDVSPEPFLAGFGHSVQGKPLPEAFHRIVALDAAVQGMPDTAVEHYEALLQGDASAPEPYLYRARRHKLEGRIYSAIKECRTALARGADPGPVMAAMGVFSSLAGFHYDARAQLAAAGELAPSRRLVIDAYFALVRHDTDIQAARDILLLDPFTRSSQDLLVSLYGAGFRTLSAEKHIATALEILPGISHTLNSVVLQRRADAIRNSRTVLTELNTTWPRLVENARLPVVSYEF